jgi:hypothetical protein
MPAGYRGGVAPAAVAAMDYYSCHLTKISKITYKIPVSAPMIPMAP